MLSIVVPVFNEKESLSAFFDVLIKNLQKLGKSYEVIFVDDGSTDTSLEILKGFEKRNKEVRVFSFRKNRGKAEALTQGFQKAKGEYVVTLDADLQDRPEEIGRLLKKSEEGFDMVSGWRKDRKDSIKMVLSSRFFNFIMSAFWGVHLHDYNCGLKLYKADAVKDLHLYGGMHRFIPLLVAEKGFEVTELSVHHEKRKFGKSKYGFSKIFKDVPDMFTILFLSRYAKRPLHFFGLIGGVVSAIGFIMILYLTILHFQGETIGNRPLLTIATLLVLAGLQIFFTGFLADLSLSMNQKNERYDSSDILKYSSD